MAFIRFNRTGIKFFPSDARFGKLEKRITSGVQEFAAAERSNMK